jgi:hypothetical protein
MAMKRVRLLNMKAKARDITICARFSSSSIIAPMKMHERAYSKIMLHAAKYPEKPVTGFLVTKVQNSGNNDVEAICVLHSPVLSMISVAYEQLSTVYNVVGMYFGNQNVLDKSISVGRLASQIKDCVLVRIDLPSKDSGLVALTFNGKDWKETGPVAVGAGARHRLTDLIQSQAYDKLYDFENHLTNLQLDWINSPEM